MKSLFALFIAGAMACNEPGNSGNARPDTTRDTMPTLKPEVTDTSSVITPSPTGDSNAVRPDTSVKSK